MKKRSTTRQKTMLALIMGIGVTIFFGSAVIYQALQPEMPIPWLRFGLSGILAIIIGSVFFWAWNTMHRPLS